MIPLSVEWIYINTVQAAEENIAPLLQKYCFDCHGQGTITADVAFDRFASDSELLTSRPLWSKALKQLDAGLMPPQGSLETCKGNSKAQQRCRESLLTCMAAFE